MAGNDCRSKNVFIPQGQHYRRKWFHRQMLTHMADIRRDWLTNQNTDWCFVMIGLSTRQSHSPLQQLKIDPVRQLAPPYWLACSGCQRIFINIRGQYGIQENIYIRGLSVVGRKRETVQIAIIWESVPENKCCDRKRATADGRLLTDGTAGRAAAAWTTTADGDDLAG